MDSIGSGRLRLRLDQLSRAEHVIGGGTSNRGSKNLFREVFPLSPEVAGGIDSVRHDRRPPGLPAALPSRRFQRDSPIPGSGGLV